MKLTAIALILLVAFSSNAANIAKAPKLSLCEAHESVPVNTTHNFLMKIEVEMGTEPVVTASSQSFSGNFKFGKRNFAGTNFRGNNRPCEYTYTETRNDYSVEYICLLKHQRFDRMTTETRHRISAMLVIDKRTNLPKKICKGDPHNATYGCYTLKNCQT